MQGEPALRFDAIVGYNALLDLADKGRTIALLPVCWPARHHQPGRAHSRVRPNVSMR